MTKNNGFITLTPRLHGRQFRICFPLGLWSGFHFFLRRCQISPQRSSLASILGLVLLVASKG